MANLKELMDALRRGEWVYGFSEEVSEALQRVRELCRQFNGESSGAIAERERLLRTIVGSVGENPVVHSPFRCDFGYNIHMGDNVTINYGFTVLDEAGVDIGSRVFIGPNVSVYTVIHALTAEQRNAGVMKALGVRIADDVWIGGNVTILPGVTIGRGAVVGAGSVVTRSVEPMTLVAGNPAGVLRRITDKDRVAPELIFGQNV